ncbi:ARM repeat-containing protein [Zopfia rhizophila CBS 207.26]|uniref:ARM repeat-containing protein n=1 Tax=Zopfia rhizophila CBS 207.26 TaxID=1314779 RepID=A0A6A6DWR8_9PEZI|nr:ARM repeat-containing protein [Zopfia rhizophila CBS 207.26]
MSVNITSDGSPTPRKSLIRFSVTEDLRVDTSPEVLGQAVGSRHPFPSRMTYQDAAHYRSIYSSLTSNMQGMKRPNSTSQDAAVPLVTSIRANMSMLPQQPPQLPQMARKASEGFKKLKVEPGSHGDQTSVVDELMQRLSEHPAAHQHSNNKMIVAGDMENGNLNPPAKDYDTSSSGSVPITPATDKFTTTPTTEPDAHPVLVDATELQKLKKELEDARNEVARMNQELHTTHLTKSTLDHAIGQSSEADYNYYKGDVTEQTISQLQNKFNASTRPNFCRQESWPLQEDTLSDKSDSLSTKPFVNGQTIWANGARQQAVLNNNAQMGQQYPPAMNNWSNDGSRSFYGANVNMGMNINQQGVGPSQAQPRPSTGQSTYRGRNGYLNEPTHFPLEQGYRGGLNSNPPSRPSSAFEPPRYNQYNGYSHPIAPGSGAEGISPTMAPMSMAPMGMYSSSNAMAPYYPRPIGSMGTRLSPEAAEFSVDAMAPTPWNAQVNSGSSITHAMANLKIHQPVAESGSQYVTPVEPMNYRRLLDRNMNCNWKYIVDKIICNNDQQASIFLQQKLKVGTAEQKFEIVEAIIAQAYPLMVNRFGNFLVQRCFEHGTPEQVIAIAGAIRGNTLTLSMDAFGCHVIQKAFDAVPEEYKATMVHELLRRIPETVIHRYACHVWQKLFELRWSDSPPQIMRYVNEALRGMWHEVALGETGSLVVQNIFENCLEEDKARYPCLSRRPCINEVLASIDVISHGQFGNWCIQHICEHGAPADRSRAIDHILRFATEYSMDQYASKVIEKCLKIGGAEFLDRYLERVCEGRPDRPRMPLIDIAGDQFGNYLIQYILTNSSAHHRELVATHVRKHMVSLRGSKYGSRVAMLCCNPAIATRPGPPAGMQISRYTHTHNMHRGGAYGGFR